MDKIKVLHIEDDPKELENMRQAFEKEENLILIGSTGDADDGLILVNKFLPEVIILDLELHEGSKDGAHFLRELRKQHIPFKPYVIVTTHNVSKTAHAMVRKTGADFIYQKSQIDYGPELIINHIHGAQEANVLGCVSMENETERKKETVYQKLINDEFELINLISKYKGYPYLKEAIELLDSGIGNYKEIIAKKYGVSAKRIENHMQYAIKCAFCDTPTDILVANYTQSINSNTGYPTVKEFVYYYCEKLRLK